MEEWSILIAEKLSFLRRKRLSNNELNHYLHSFISILEKHPALHKLYDKPVGVWEGYSLRSHTVMVMNQYLNYFISHNLPHFIKKDVFLLLLALHDVGKPKAVEKGNKDLQHHYSRQIIDEIKKNLSFNIEEFISLIDGDPIGRYFCGESLAETKKQILEMTKKSPLSISDFFHNLCIYYQVDAGSYTKIAGGVASEEKIFRKNFEFNKAKKRLWFSKKYEKLFNELEISL